MAMPAPSTSSMKARFNKAKEASKKQMGGTTLSASEKGIRHMCRISDVKLIDGDKGKSIRWEFTCVEGDEIGEKAIRFSNFDTDDQFRYALSDLRRAGVDVDNMEVGDTDKSFFESLEPELATLRENKPGVRITVKENGDYINVYIDRLIETDAEIPEAAAEEGAEGTAEETGDEAETGAEEEAGTEFELKQKVSYTVKGKKVSGVILKINEDDTLDIKNDVTKKTDNVDKAKVEVLATVG